MLDPKTIKRNDGNDELYINSMKQKRSSEYADGELLMEDSSSEEDLQYFTD